MKRDGDLRRMLREHLPHAQWTSIETGVTAGGVPDLAYCLSGGAMGWVECKVVHGGWRPVLRPAQVVWIGRCARLGGRVWVAVRKLRRSSFSDDHNGLYLVHGLDIERLRDDGLWGAPFAARCRGEPGEWDWTWIEGLLRWDSAGRIEHEAGVRMRQVKRLVDGIPQP